MDRLTVGILAHVDAGKTTLSEALLYLGGKLRKLGRVDHKDAFLDTDVQERERGITIFSKQAVLDLPAGWAPEGGKALGGKDFDGLELTLLDTPGHVDFAAETERALGALDAAILVISGPDGPQGHTFTLWKLLSRHGVPTFLFLNKMDQNGASKGAVEEQLKGLLGGKGVDFGAFGTPGFWEAAALGDEAALNEYLETEQLSDGTLRRLIGERKVFPLYFGSALKLEGVEDLLAGVARFAPRPRWGEAFAARVFKVSHDPAGKRLAHLKITGGVLRVKDTVNGEKVDQLRVYSGAKFTAPDAVPAGAVCAVAGLDSAYPGQALGAEAPWAGPALEPPLSYRLILPQGTDPHVVLPKLRQLAEEDPQLHLEWHEALGEIRLRLMGQVQAEILRRTIADRFGLAVEFGPGSIVYRETIAGAVEGVGHFEPLRHYAEVHLLLEPLPAGSGVELDSICPEDALAGNWQRLILTHLAERVHPGVLTGSPVTDVRFTLVAGRAHEKHTEGGDFRQATYRAVRQGLMSAESILLEPWYDFRLEMPTENLGRALADLQRMGGETGAPETLGEETVISGSAPVEQLRHYAAEVAAYTRGRGRLTCVSGGYRPCAEQERIVAEMGYDPERDVENPAGSVFCSHGAGVNIPWDEAPRHMHLPLLQLGRGEDAPPEEAGPRRSVLPAGGLEGDKELMAIFERTYGAVKPRAFRPAPKPTAPAEGGGGKRTIPPPKGPEYLLVDGYNIIFAWEELKEAARENLDGARKALMDLLSDYQGYRRNRVILVFDAYRVPQGTGSVASYHGIRVVYTKEAQTADSYIEKASYQLAKEGQRVRVATSDAAEQFIILGHGCLRMSAAELRQEVERTRGEIAEILRRNNLRLPSQPVKAAFERAEGKPSP